MRIPLLSQDINKRPAFSLLTYVDNIGKVARMKIVPVNKDLKSGLFK